jgi:hypothetical protein
MNRLVVATAFAFFPFSAFAQSAPAPTPKFVPWTMTEQDNSGLAQYLNSQPFGVVAPIVQFLGQHENDAQKAADDKANADAEKDKPVKDMKPAK